MTTTQPAESITFLRCKSPLVLTKTWHLTTIKDYDTAKHFAVVEKPVHSLVTLAAVLDAAMKKPQYAAIRGTPTTLETTNVTRTLTNFADLPKHWIMFDIDNFKPDVSPLQDPAAGVAQWITDHLPEAFHSVKAYWQLSASAGHVSRDPAGLRAHVWFWLDKPVTGVQWKRWAEKNNIAIDKSVLSPVQLHYTAAPVIELGHDPYTKRAGFTVDFIGEVKTDALKLHDLQQQRELDILDNGDQVLRDPRKVPGIVGQFCTAFNIEAALDFIPGNFTHADTGGEWDGRRLDFTKGSGGKGGAYIHSDQLHLINMQNHAPCNTQGTALNAFDLVRIYKFGDLDPMDPFLRLDVTTLPSHQAMSAWAQDQLVENVPDVDQTGHTDTETAAVDVLPAKKPKAPKGPQYPLPYQGPMADMVAAVLRSTKVKQPELTVLGVLIGMAGACGGHYRLPSGMRLNLYGLNISPSGSGKDTIRYATRKVAEAAMATTLGCPASGQGLQDALPEGGGVLVETDEAGHLFAGMNSKNGASYSIELAKIFLELFSAGQGSYKTRLKAKSKTETGSRTLPHPSVSFCGSTTREKLSTALTDDNVTDGLIGRFLFAMGRGDAPFNWSTPAFVMPKSMEAAGAKLAWAPGIDRPIVYAAGLTNRMETWAQEYWAVPDLPGSYARAFATRSIEKLERIAGVLAVWENPIDPVITQAHVEWAKQLVDASNAMVVDFLQRDLGGTSDEVKLALKTLGIIHKLVATPATTARANEASAPPGCVFKSRLLRYAHLDVKTMDAVLATLEGRGDIELVTLGKRKAQGIRVSQGHV